MCYARFIQDFLQREEIGWGEETGREKNYEEYPWIPLLYIRGPSSV